MYIFSIVFRTVREANSQVQPMLVDSQWLDLMFYDFEFWTINR